MSRLDLDYKNKNKNSLNKNNQHFILLVFTQNYTDLKDYEN